MSDVGKVVKMTDGKRYLITEGSLAAGWLGGQRIVRQGKGIPSEVNGQPVWLNEMHRSLSPQDVVKMTPYRAPRPKKPKAPVEPTIGPIGHRSRRSPLAERSLLSV
jgi:hypothetical protein